MHLRNGKDVLPAPPGPVRRTRRCVTQPFRLLDLPPEVRVLIYRYAIGVHYADFELNIERGAKIGTSLRHVLSVKGLWDYTKNIDCFENTNCYRLTALLLTCKMVSQEALPILYDQTQFEVCMSSADDRFSETDLPSYNIELDGWSYSPNTTAAFILRHVRHLSIIFSIQDPPPNERLLDSPESYRKRMHALYSLTDHGVRLKTLKMTFNQGDDDEDEDSHFMNSREDQRTFADMMRFWKFKGHLVVNFSESSPSDESIVLFKRSLSGDYSSNELQKPKADSATAWGSYSSIDMFKISDWPDDCDEWASNLPYPRYIYDSD